MSKRLRVQYKQAIRFNLSASHSLWCVPCTHPKPPRSSGCQGSHAKTVWRVIWRHVARKQKDHEQRGARAAREKKTVKHILFIYIKLGQKKRRGEDDKRPPKFGRMIKGITGLSLEMIEMIICCDHSLSSPLVNERKDLRRLV